MSKNLKDVTVIGFDADDTLWINEPLFREAENEFCQLLSAYDVESKVMKALYQTEMNNIGRFGYGIKGFTLSMIETALAVSNHQLDIGSVQQIMDIAYRMMDAPVEVLPEVEKTLKSLRNKYRLVLVTKGDLFDQEKKLNKSNLQQYFHHIEIVSEKKENNYQKLLDHLDIAPHDFLMIGNSLKSDVLPAVKIGCHAIHIPFHTTWIHETVDPSQLKAHNYTSLARIDQLVGLLL